MQARVLISLRSFSFFTVCHAGYEYREFDSQCALTAALHSSPSANRLHRRQPLSQWGGTGPSGGCVSLARFQDLALAHWTHSAGKDAVQRGIHHLQHRLLFLRLSLLPLQESRGRRRRESETHTKKEHKTKTEKGNWSFFFISCGWKLSFPHSLQEHVVLFFGSTLMLPVVLFGGRLDQYFFLTSEWMCVFVMNPPTQLFTSTIKEIKQSLKISWGFCSGRRLPNSSPQQEHFVLCATTILGTD